MTDAVQTPEEIAAAKTQADAAKLEAKAQADAAKAQAKAQAAEQKAATKLAADAAKTEAKAAKDAAKAEAKIAADGAKAEAARLKAEAKAAKVETVQKVKQPQSNGVTRPRPDGDCGKIWALADSISASLKQPVPIATLLVETRAGNLNDATTRTQYARWKTYNGVYGVVAKAIVAAPAPAVAEVTEVAETQAAE